MASVPRHPAAEPPGASELRVTGQEALPPCLPRAGSASCPLLPIPGGWEGLEGPCLQGRAGACLGPLRFSGERERAWLLALRGPLSLRKHHAGGDPLGAGKQLQAARQWWCGGEAGRRPSSPSSWWAPSVPAVVKAGPPRPSPRPRGEGEGKEKRRERKKEEGEGKEGRKKSFADSVLKSYLTVFILRLTGAQGLGWQLGRGDQQALRAPAHLPPERGNSVPASWPRSLAARHALLLEALGGASPSLALETPFTAARRLPRPSLAQAGLLPCALPPSPVHFSLKKSQII